MAGVDFMFNIGRGGLKYYYYAVKNALVVTAGQFTSGATAAFVLVPIETTSIEADGTLRDYDDLAALIAGVSNEQTNQARKVLVAADLAALPAPDDTNERMDLDFPDVTYTALAGNAIGKIVVGFRPLTASADSAIIPLFAQAVTLTPDGNDVVYTPNAAGVWRSS